MEMVVNRLSAAAPQLELCHSSVDGQLPIALNHNAVKCLTYDVGIHSQNIRVCY